MLKKIIVAIALITIVGILVLGAVNRTMAKVGSETTNESIEIHQSDNVKVQVQGYQTEDISAGQQDYGGGNSEEVIDLAAVSDDELSENEEAGLLFMREEENLAHDVYAAFYAQYGTQNFQNISQSEFTHSEAVKTLIDWYGLADPVSSEMGVFTNPDLQAFYEELILRGSQSLAEAIKVGAAVEEIDILDLQDYLAQTDNADIHQVYQNLLAGSENHLRAFVAKYKQLIGEIYVPQYLSLDKYQTIITADTQVGGGDLGTGVGNGGYRRGQP